MNDPIKDLSSYLKGIGSGMFLGFILGALLFYIWMEGVI